MKRPDVYSCPRRLVKPRHIPTDAIPMTTCTADQPVSPSHVAETAHVLEHDLNLLCVGLSSMDSYRIWKLAAEFDSPQSAALNAIHRHDLVKRCVQYALGCVIHRRDVTLLESSARDSDDDGRLMVFANPSSLPASASQPSAAAQPVEAT